MTISRKRAEELLADFARQSILVVGDLMLDRYIYGSVSRISPEAPVPVVHVTQERSMPGGACNVAWNVRSLGGGSSVAGVLGRDAAAAELSDLLQRVGVSTAASVESQDFCTIVKTRIIAERQQVVRVDWEKTECLDDRIMDDLKARVVSAVAGATGVILEDYGKGVITQEIVNAALKAAQARGIPIGLDPKENHQLQVAGITVGTPNRKEAFAMAHEKETPVCDNPLEDKPLRRVADILMEKWKPRILMITLGPQGMLLVSQDGVKHVPTRAREVFDVSGAGDTVIATCVLALAAGASPLEAAELANYAAGVVVGKIGTAACTQEELMAYIR
jgi:rfaE bifunctional protein kinase chain/domain